MIERLKPCPKCGGTPILHGTKVGNMIIPAIECKQCGCMFRQRFWSMDQLIHAWNRRSNDIHQEYGGKD